jgi:hypothetical protein
MSKGKRKALDNLPANDFERAADVFQWIFHLNEVIDLFGWPVNARYLSAALRDLREASCAKPGNAREVQLAWQLVLDTAGLNLTGKFIHSGAYKDFCPYVRPVPSGGSKIALWRGEGKIVVARLQFLNDKGVGIRFDIEEEE